MTKHFVIEHEKNEDEDDSFFGTFKGMVRSVIDEKVPNSKLSTIAEHEHVRFGKI